MVYNQWDKLFMMNDKIQIELQEIMLAQLLDHAMHGIQETGEYTPMLAWTFKELANKLPNSAWNAEAIKEFAASLEQEEDYPLLEEDDDYY